jgi:hypothetical protein
MLTMNSAITLMTSRYAEGKRAGMDDWVEWQLQQNVTWFTSFNMSGIRIRTVRIFSRMFALEDAIGSHACSLEASMRVI